MRFIHMKGHVLSPPQRRDIVFLVERHPAPAAPMESPGPFGCILALPTLGAGPLQVYQLLVAGGSLLGCPDPC